MGWTVYNSDGQILQGSSTLADDAVTTAKILADAVTNAKLANMETRTVKANATSGSANPTDIAMADGDFLIANGSALVTVPIAGDVAVSNAGASTIQANAVTTAKILDANVTNAKLANMAANTIRVRNAGDAGVPQEVALSTTQILIGNGTGFTPAALNGEATMSNAGGILIADNIIDEANLKSDNSPTNDHVLTAKSSASGGLTWAAAVGGKVLQVVSAVKTGGTSTTQTSWQAVSNLLVSITPTLSTSKVLVLVSDNSLYRNTVNNYFVTIYRGSTNIGNSNYGFVYGYGISGGAGRWCSIVYLDSPSSTSAITYQVYGKIVTDGTLSFANGDSYATITCMEIGV
jgi:hypothetical protein